MKKIIIFCLLLAVSNLFAQRKIDLDKYWIKCEFVDLPKFIVKDFEKRTFQKVFRVNFKNTDFFNKEPEKNIRLAGFQPSSSIPTVKIEVDLDDVSFYTVDKIERVEDIKDKDGKVVSKKYYYKAVGTYKAFGKYSLLGPSSGSNGASEQIDGGSLNTEIKRETGEFDSYSKAYEEFNRNRDKNLDLILLILSIKH
jgi:hypothetical protein